MKIISKTKGFTLIELMVVVAIMALLTGIITANLTSGRAKARDGKRISDLGQIQLALEQYFNRCGQYPVAPLLTSANNGCPISPAITFGTFLTQIPTDNGTSYDYFTDSTTAPTSFILHTSLEANNISVQRDSLPESKRSSLNSSGFIPSSSIVCYDVNNPTSKQYCVGSAYLP